MAQQGQPQQVAPAAPAPQLPQLPHVPRVGKAFNVLVIRDYLRRVQASAPNVPQPYQQVVDHFWQHFLAHYFHQGRRFGVEREAFTHRDSGQAADILVSNRRNGGTHQVILVEAKRFPNNTRPGWETRYNWRAVKDSVRNHMVESRRWLTTVQTTFGIAAVGDKVRFYYMSMQNE
ncbi:hypothetical protein CBS63078_6590 [Aspergillus niger]|uniref:Cytochrome P450 family protein n=2 Tax=Aspergillus niger TaxID=5061 RepID=A0A254U0G7_ASPNG|nr:hypothetical protein CBS11852_10314 [Aspergillus niger]KAI2882030.1 hypothetical protein CBS13152_8908 [Aspergillus niger]KAI2901710.1 hypothetical protein CBS63078_6590 [Aspergillus niger]KAI2921006.1 hypothetical protein CBS147371_2855 [Aspergillus niger]KAI2930434.1 hypothetical protein CBS147320_3136 [Aspergillus niger]